MRLYFFMLAVLACGRLFSIYVELRFGHPPDIYLLKFLADIAAYGACLTAAFAGAFGRKIGTPRRWKAVMNLTLALGGFSTLLVGFPEVFGIQIPIPEGPLNLLRMMGEFVVYVLFAIPVIIYSREQAGGDG